LRLEGQEAAREPTRKVKEPERRLGEMTSRLKQIVQEIEAIDKYTEVEISKMRSEALKDRTLPDEAAYQRYRAEQREKRNSLAYEHNALRHDAMDLSERLQGLKQDLRNGEARTQGRIQELESTYFGEEDSD
jgi:hypothetical protein